MLLEIIELIGHIANISICIGSIVTILSIKINSSPIEETFIEGKLRKSAVIFSEHPKLFNFGLILLITGSILTVLIEIQKLIW